MRGVSISKKRITILSGVTVFFIFFALCSVRFSFFKNNSLAGLVINALLAPGVTCKDCVVPPADTPVTLVPIPLGSTPAQIQALLTQHRYVYFLAGTYNIGSLRVDNWNGGVIFGAGRLTTVLNGSITISNSTNVTLGNMTIQYPASTSTIPAVTISGTNPSVVSIVSTLISTATTGTGIGVHILAPGEFIVQGTHIKANDIGLLLENDNAKLTVFGGNYANNRVHLKQLKGHLDARSIGFQMQRGGADIEINAPSQVGYHIIEGIRSEGSNSASPNEKLLFVPPTTAPVNVIMRANALATQLQYASYNAQGILILVANANYSTSADDLQTPSVYARSANAKIYSYGNSMGRSFDPAGPFDIGSGVALTSVGDIWLVPNGNNGGPRNYSQPSAEIITAATLTAAGKPTSGNMVFAADRSTTPFVLPQVPEVKVAAFPVIANLADLMTSVATYGAIPDDGIDDSLAFDRAFTANGGISKPLFFPAGRYELSRPIVLNHYAGGGFWGQGKHTTLLVSTTGSGVIKTNGAGYATFVDIGFENGAGATTPVADFAWDGSPGVPSNGGALQANMFYRTRFEGGGAGLVIGTPNMGSEFMIVDSVFKNITLPSKLAEAVSNKGYNALTNTIVRSRFYNVDMAYVNTRGSFNFYSNTLSRINTVGLFFASVVGNGFIASDMTFDNSPVPLIKTQNSSSKAYILLDRVKALAPRSAANASEYYMGGGVVVIDATLPSRPLIQSGGVGTNSLVVENTLAPTVRSSGWAHPFFYTK